MPCGWEGNRRSSDALAMRHRLLQRFVRPPTGSQPRRVQDSLLHLADSLLIRLATYCQHGSTPQDKTRQDAP